MEEYVGKRRKNIKVYIQSLPPPNSCWDDVKIFEDKRTICVRSVMDLIKSNKNKYPNYWTFYTDGILNDKHQKDIFELYFKELLESAIMGVDLLIFSYGQTGCGKSSTIHGLFNTYENRGLTPRILTELFKLKEKKQYEFKINYFVTYVEIHKFFVKDLLQNNDKKIRNPFRDVHLVEIDSEFEGIRQLFLGEANRTIYQTSYYSHLATSIFTIHVKNASLLISNPVEKYSKIHIIDMAGIDICGNTTCKWKSPADIALGNLNKLHLEQCLILIEESLVKNINNVKNSGIIVDYLGKSLSPQSMLRFIGHIWPTREHLAITLSTLNFANVARHIEPAKLKSSYELTPSYMIQNLKQKLESLEQQMYLNSMLMNDDMSFNITRAKYEQMKHAVEEFIKDKSNELNVLNVTDATIALRIFKDFYNKLELEKYDALVKIQDMNALLTNKSSKASKSNLNTGGGTTQPWPTRTYSRSYHINKQASKETNIMKKRKSTIDRHSRTSKMSNKVIKQCTSRDSIGAGGSTSKSGVSLGQILSYNYQGDVTKSLKLKSKMLIRPSLQSLSKESVLKVTGSNSDIWTKNLSDINLQSGEDDLEAIWAAYIEDESYSYAKMNANLESLTESSRQILKNYNTLLNELKILLHEIDDKKNDLFRIKLYQDVSDLPCSSGNEQIKLYKAEEEIHVRLKELINESACLKENILALQSELNININEYNRIKKLINQDYTNYCLSTFNIKMTTFEKVTENAEDDLHILEYRGTEPREAEEQARKYVFNKLQNDLRKMQALKFVTKKNK